MRAKNFAERRDVVLSDPAAEFHQLLRKQRLGIEHLLDGLDLDAFGGRLVVKAGDEAHQFLAGEWDEYTRAYAGNRAIHRVGEGLVERHRKSYIGVGGHIFQSTARAAGWIGSRQRRRTRLRLVGMEIGMNRRQFARLSGMTLAAAQMPAYGQNAMAGQKPVGYAAIGLGTISDIFMRACARSQKAKITALVTGHPETKGKRYAAMYGIPESSVYTYETFDRIRDNKAVDAVYVGLPNSMHREYTVRAAAAGKHVLCEKPMAISSAECEQMIAACKRAGVKLMIGYRVHYEPTHGEARRIAQSGELGPLVAFEGAFGFDAKPNQWRLTRQFGGGGPLMDVGIYPMNEIRWILGEEPTGFTAVPSTLDRTSGRFAEMEQTMDWTLKFPSGVIASLGCTYGCDMPGFLRIHGSKGSLELTNAFSYTNVRLRGIGGGQHVDMTSSSEETAHFLLEADHFADCVRTGAEPNTPGEEGLHDLQAMEAVYRAAGTPIA